MGWLRSHGIIKVGTEVISGYYIRDDWQSMLLSVDNSNYDDLFVSEDCVIKFKVTSDETGDMEMQMEGDIDGYPYYSGEEWNLWHSGDTWILSKIGEGPNLGEPPIADYKYDTTLSTYVYDGDEYYTGEFNYRCLEGEAGTFRHNLSSGVTITLSAVWPDNFHKRISGVAGEEVGTYSGGYSVGFAEWTASHLGDTYYIHRIRTIPRRKFGHLHYFTTASLEDATLDNNISGYYHDELGQPNFDTEQGFYFHEGTSDSIPITTQSYILRWCHYVPDEPPEGETESQSGSFIFDNTLHPNVTFSYAGKVFETDVVDDNKGLIYMTDTSSWR